MEGQRRILVVDDDAEAREMLEEFLAEEGYAVETAPDGVTALDKLHAFRADVVVTDFEMPGMDGLELIRLIQSRYPGRPTLLVTARDDAVLTDAVAAGGSRPVACLHKPIDLDDLTLVVEQLLDVADARAH
jgi:two-component system, OmpR family, response regulator MprA